MLTSCVVQLVLLLIRSSSEPHILSVTQNVLWLRHHGVKIHITIGEPTAPAYTTPAPALLELLSGTVTQIDYYSVPRQQAMVSQVLSAAPVSFTKAHFDALKSCSGSLTACAVGLGDHLPADTGLDAIAYLTGLTKLHLTDTLFCRPGRIMLRSLGQLFLVSDLTLQFTGPHCCCRDILNSSRKTLRSVDLLAPSWTADTYNSL